MTGTFIAVVGPSGVGKDTVMAALAQSDPNFVLARRVITRPSTAGGEDFEGITKPEFIDRAARGDFVMHWEAHGLCYGIPRNVISYLNAGRNVLANLSRDTLKQAMALFPMGASFCSLPRQKPWHSGWRSVAANTPRNKRPPAQSGTQHSVRLAGNYDPQ